MSMTTQDLREQLAASQAREQQLRELLSKVVVKSQLNDGILPLGIEAEIDAALAIPSGTAVLDRANKLYAAEVLKELGDVFKAYDKDDVYVDAEVAGKVADTRAEQLRKEAEK